jgi:DNA repair ATPase RecN
MGLFNTYEKKVIAELCKKSEAIGNDVSKEIDEIFEDLKTDYEANKIVLKEFNDLVSELESKLSPLDVEKLHSFSSRLYKVKRCAKKGVEAIREIARDQKKATNETIREYQEYLYS